MGREAPVRPGGSRIPPARCRGDAAPRTVALRTALLGDFWDIRWVAGVAGGSIGRIVVVLSLIAVVVAEGHEGTDLAPISGAGGSLPLKLYERAMLLNRLSEAKQAVSYVDVGSDAAVERLGAGEVDYACSDVQTPSPGVLYAPTLAAAVVFPYNIDGLGTGEQLVLDRFSLVGIFNGSINRWNDEYLLMTNPHLKTSLPDREITVIARGGPSGTTDIMSTAMSRLSPTWAALIGEGTTIDWSQSNARVIQAPNNSKTMIGWVLNTVNSIGYNVLSETVGHVSYNAWHPRKHPAHSDVPESAQPGGANVVQASASSLEKAVVQWDDSTFSAAVHGDISVTDDDGAWPVASFTYLAVRANFVRPGTTCAERAATLAFWRWYYNTAAISETASLLGFFRPPIIVAARVLSTLEEALQCTGVGSIPEVDPTRTYDLWGPTEFFGAMQLIDTGYTFFQDSKSQFAYKTISEHGWPTELSFLMLVLEPELAQADEIFSAADVGETFVDRVGSVGLAIYYRVDGISANTPLAMTVEILADIYLGIITAWDDSAIRLLNPSLSIPATPIVVLSRSDSCDENLVLTSSFSRAVPGFNTTVGVSRSPTFPGTSISHRSEEAIVSELSRTNGAIVYAGFDALEERQAYLIVEGAAVSTPLAPEVERLSDCVIDDSLQGQDFDGDGGVCWPLSLMVVAKYRRTFFSDQTGAASCTTGAAVANFLSWLYSSEEVKPTISAFELGAAGELERALLLPHAYDIQCDGLSILDPPPLCTRVDFDFTVSSCDGTSKRLVQFHWIQPRECYGGVSLPLDAEIECDHVPWGSAVGVGVIVFCVLSLVPVLAALAWTYQNKSSEIVKYMQPLFCLIFLYSALVTNMMPLLFLGEDSRTMCNIRLWMFNIAFTVTFAALFSKLYRVWRLFVNPKARKRIITNAKVVQIIVVFAGLDAITCLVWTLTDPPGDILVLTPLPGVDGVDIPIRSCVGAQGSNPAEIVLFFLKVVLLSGGIFLAFQTWNVDAMVAEARPLGIAIFNIAFVGLLSAFIIVLLDVSPTVEVVLTTVAVLYSVTAAVIAVFGPKMLALRRGDKVELTAISRQTSGGSARRHGRFSSVASVSDSARPLALGGHRPSIAPPADELLPGASANGDSVAGVDTINPLDTEAPSRA